MSPLPKQNSSSLNLSASAAPAKWDISAVNVSKLPVLGGPATWQISVKKDVFAEPMIVVNISKSGKTVVLERLHPVSKITGHPPAYSFLDYDYWHHVYTPDELRKFTELEPKNFTATQTKEGLWFIQGTADKVNFGYAMYSAKQRILS
jgi:hypothetical protein